MIKVLHTITDLSPDGAQRTLLRLVTALNKEGFHNRVVSLMKGGHLVSTFEQAGIEVVQLGMKSKLPTIVTLHKLRSAISTFRPDLIQGWMYHGNLAASIGSSLTGRHCPVAWNIRRALYDPRRDKALTRGVIRLGAKLSHRADAIIYCADVARRQHEALGFAARRPVLIPNGFDVSRFSPARADREEVRRELTLSSNTPLIGIVGRYHPQKDYPTFLKAAHEALKSLPKLHFVMIGRDVTNTNRELVEEIRSLGLAGKITLLGERQDVPRLVASLDLFVSSSENEGFSNVVGEAMASGVPCVATDAGASSELLDGEGGVVARGDYHALSQAIVARLRLSPQERLELGTRLRNRILERYTLPAMVSAYATLYRNLTHRSTSPLSWAA